MSEIVIKSFEEQMRIAGIAGELERAEERGYKIGYERGFQEGFNIGRDKIERKYIPKLLKMYTPQKISEDLKIPIERVLEIQNQ